MRKVEAIKVVANAFYAEKQYLHKIKYWELADSRLLTLLIADNEHQLASMTAEAQAMSSRAFQLSYILPSNCAAAAMELAKANFDSFELMWDYMHIGGRFDEDSHVRGRHQQPWVLWTPSKKQVHRQAARVVERQELWEKRTGSSVPLSQWDDERWERWEENGNAGPLFTKAIVMGHVHGPASESV